MVDRTHRELTDDDIARIAGTYHAWRGDRRSAASTPTCPASARAAHARRDPQARPRADARPLRRRRGRCEDDGEPFDEKMKRLTATLREQQAEAAKLDAADRRQPEGAWVWRVSGATAPRATCRR